MGVFSKKRDEWFFLYTGILILVGFVFTIFSWLSICTESCAETHDYRFFGFLFEPMGLVFFATLGCLHFLSLRFPLCTFIEGLLIAGAMGMELVFVGVQKYVIGQWCPVCLSIAALVGLLGLTFILKFVLKIIDSVKQNREGTFMWNFGIGLSSLSTFAIGVFLALSGVAKPESALANNFEQDNPAFGVKDSKVEVYVITDWFCPACRRIEPLLDKIYPRIMKKAGLFFIDKPIHPETMNFVPYNLSFMVKEKKKYFELRKVLLRLAQQTKAPSLEQVQEIVKTVGVKYQPLNYSDIDSGIRFFEGVTQTFNVTSTPTVVIANRKKLNAKKLVGTEITEANVLRAIDEIGEQEKK